MAKYPASSSRVYLDGYNISGDMNGWNQDLTQDTPVVTALSDAGPRRLVDNYDHKDSYLGFFDGVDDAIDEILHALLGSASDHFYGKVIATSLSSGIPAEGSIAYESILHLASKPLNAAVGGAVMLNLDGEGANGLTRAVVLRAAAVSGAGNGTGRNLGATTSGQIFQVVYRVLAFNGTNITLTLEGSSDDAVGDPYAAIAGLAETFTAIGAARDTTTAATEAWKRVVVSGTFTTATILVTAGVVAGS